MLCSNCGQSIADNVPFCKNCGSPAPPASGTDARETAHLGAAAAGPGLAAAPPPTSRLNRTPLIIGSVATAIIVIAGLAVGLYFGLRGDDSDKTTSGNTTVTSYTSATVAGLVGPTAHHDLNR